MMKSLFKFLTIRNKPSSLLSFQVAKSIYPNKFNFFLSTTNNSKEDDKNSDKDKVKFREEPIFYQIYNTQKRLFNDEKEKKSTTDFVHKDEEVLSVTLNDVPINDIHKISSVKELSLNKRLESNLTLLKISTLSEVQKLVFPLFNNTNFDILGCDQTGSGKTLAYIIPILNSLLSKGPPKITSKRVLARPIALILVPTRELSIQVGEEINKFCFGLNITCLNVFGGQDISIQMSKINNYKHIDILVGTPGRLTDLIKREMICLENVQYFILDEGDRMLDMGFKPQIDEIIYKFNLPSKEMRRNMMFSATFSKEVLEISKSYMKEYIKIFNNEGKYTMNDKIKQEFIKINSNFEKFNHLLKVIKEIPNTNQILVFTQTKVFADKLSTDLHHEGVSCHSIHGDKRQNIRDMIIKDFNNKTFQVLIATDVAARGIDFKDLYLVFNYDCPHEIDSYIHRSGRTGRKGKDGRVITFIDENVNPKVIKEITALLINYKIQVPSFFSEFNQKSNYVQPNYNRRSNSHSSSYNRGGNRNGNSSSDYNGGYREDRRKSYRDEENRQYNSKPSYNRNYNTDRFDDK